MPSKQGPRLWVRCTNLQHPKYSLPELLDAHPLNQGVQLLLPTRPDESPGPPPPCHPELAAALLANAACLVRGPLGDLLHDLSNQGAWDSRAVTAADGTVAVAAEGQALCPCALLVGTQLACNGGAAITPQGQLHLTVTPEMYAELGLVGARGSILQGAAGRGSLRVQEP